MTKKPIIISSFGLININLSKFTDEDDFILVFYYQNFRMNRIFAEFISSTISQIHRTDPTIEQINFANLFTNKTDTFNEFTKDLISEDSIALLKQISSGYSFKLRFISIILGNEELFNKINELFLPDFSVENLSIYLDFIQCCYNFSQFSPDFDFSGLIGHISRNFYLVDPQKSHKLPHSIQYSIISNPCLQIKTKDSFLDLICEK